MRTRALNRQHHPTPRSGLATKRRNYGWTNERHDVTARGVLIITAGLSAFAIGAVSAARFLHLLGQGIALSTIAAAMVMYSAVTALSEVPTGIAGDRFGRGRIRAAGLVASAVGAALIAFSMSVSVLLFGFVLMAFGTASLSGAAEAWYVDTTDEATRTDESGDANDDPTHVRALAAATSAKNLGLAAGAATAAVFVAINRYVLNREVTGTALTGVFLLVIGALLADAAITVANMKDARPARERRVSAAGASSKVRLLALAPASRVPVVIVAGIYFVLGVLLAATELLTPARLLDTNDFATSAMTLGALICLARLIASGVAQMGPKLARWAGSPLRAAGWVQAAAALAAFAAVWQTTFGTIIVFVGIYVLSAPIMVLTATELHQHVDAEHRNTLLSAMSLAAMAGAGLMASLIWVTTLSHVAYGVIAGCAVAVSAVPALLVSRGRPGPAAVVPAA